jgi:hypothetical protein
VEAAARSLEWDHEIAGSGQTVGQIGLADGRGVVVAVVAAAIPAVTGRGVEEGVGERSASALEVRKHLHGRAAA